ncbi:hypothetical protein D9M69_208650 [compost metagenome]
MSETDNKQPEVAKSVARRLHHGAMGQVLQRFLGQRGEDRSFSLMQLEELWQRAAAIDPAIGLHLFAQFTPKDRYILVHLALASANIGQALRYWERYARLGSELDQLPCLFETPDQIGMELRIEGSGALVRHVGEHCLVMTMTQIREGCVEPLLPLRAEFAWQRPAYHAEYAQWFGPSLHFSSARTCLVFDKAALDLPMRGHHPVLAEMIASSLEQRLAQQQQFGGHAAKVANHIREALRTGAHASLESAATAQHLSPRTLHRRLQEQELSFRRIFAAVCAEMEQSLELQGLNRNQIAERLGYADSNAYRRARKRWQEQGEA